MPLVIRNLFYSVIKKQNQLVNFQVIGYKRTGIASMYETELKFIEGNLTAKT